MHSHWVTLVAVYGLKSFNFVSLNQENKIMLGFLKTLFGGGNSQEIGEIIKSGAFLVDVRSPGEVASGKVKGSVNIPLGQIQSHLAKFKGKKAVVVFCQSGMRSGQAARILKQNGIENVYNGGSWRSVDQIVKSKK